VECENGKEERAMADEDNGDDDNADGNDDDDNGDGDDGDGDNDDDDDDDDGGGRSKTVGWTVKGRTRPPCPGIFCPPLATPFGLVALDIVLPVGNFGSGRNKAMWP
jgi:hypothetical protein